jgi:HK97 family phage major capsid protein
MGESGSGTYLVPTPFSTQIIDKVRNQSVLLRAGARTVPMDAQTLNMARVASDMSAQWHTELAAITASDMTFERVTFTAQTLAALAVLSVEIAEDSVVEGIISDAIAKVLALELDRASLRGSGVLPEIKGIRNQTGVGVDANTLFGANGSTISGSAPTGAVAWDWASKAISTLWGLNETPTAMIYSARTAGLLDLLRASTGEVLVPPPSVAALQRFFSNQIPNNLTQGTNNDASECYFGDFSQALIGMRTELMLEISRQANVGATSMFTNMGVGIRAYLRADLQLARPAAFRVVCGIRG